MSKSKWTPALAASAALLVGLTGPATAHAPTQQGHPVSWADYEASQGSVHGQSAVHAEPVHAGTPVWRGRDGRNYCRRKDGTVGMIVGGAAGALLGREVDRGYSRTLGTILGAAGGALLGRAVDRSSSQCR